MTFKKLHKKLEKLLGGEILNEEGALLSCGLVLVEAFEQASQRGDTAAMIDIADRWLLLSKMLSGENIEQDEDAAFVFKAPLGFVPEIELEIEEEEFDDDAPERPNKSESRIKVRKKSRTLRKYSY